MNPLIIRADSGPDIGSGHVMRCMAFAQEWQKYNGEVIFISNCTKKGKTKIEARGFHVIQLEKSFPDPLDIKTTLNILKEKHCAWLIIDGYHFTCDYQKKIKNNGYKTLVIDDYHHLPSYNADILLNQNLGSDDIVYNTSSKTVQLKGARFVMLRDEFLDQQPAERSFFPKAKKILITMGGSDPDNVTLKVVKALNLLMDQELFIKIITGPDNKNTDSIKTALNSSVFTAQIISNTNDMPSLLSWADMAVSAGGSTSWELLYMGVPSIFIINAENQRNIVTGIEKNDSGINAGWHESLYIKTLAEKIKNLILDSEKRKTLQLNGQQLINGKGKRLIFLLINSLKKNRKLKITIVSDEKSWINPYSKKLMKRLANRGHLVVIIHSVSDIQKGDIVFYLGCGQLVPASILNLNTHNLVVHESALPKGKGWSPLTWQILEGKDKIPITLLEAEKKVDSGMIYSQEILNFNGFELVDELREKQGECSIGLCEQFIDNYANLMPNASRQTGKDSFYTRRNDQDSRLDMDQTLREQFNLMRVADNKRYPLFFELNGNKFELKIKKIRTFDEGT